MEVSHPFLTIKHTPCSLRYLWPRGFCGKTKVYNKKVTFEVEDEFAHILTREKKDQEIEK